MTSRIYRGLYRNAYVRLDDSVHLSWVLRTISFTMACAER
jgi:hypothetical protein